MASRALRDVARLDALSLPLALYGGAAGLLAIEVNVWLGVLATTPAAWVPETFLVPRSLGRTVARAPRVVAVALIATVAVVAGAVLGTVDLAATAFVVGLGVLCGVELTVDRRFVIPPVLAAGLALALVVDRSCRRRGRARRCSRPRRPRCRGRSPGARGAAWSSP